MCSNLFGSTLTTETTSHHIDSNNGNKRADNNGSTIRAMHIYDRTRGGHASIGSIYVLLDEQTNV